MLTHNAIRRLRRLLGAKPPLGGTSAGPVSVLDGQAALTLIEAGLSEAIALGAGFPAQTAEMAWRARQECQDFNWFGGHLSGIAAESPRGALSAAMGLTLSGVRASLFLSGPDLAACRDLLQTAAAQRLPLVIQVAARTLSPQGLGSGHEALHLAADAGCLLLVAATVQEAVDLALTARQVAEQLLIPVVVACDAEQTALSVQDVRLPEPEWVARFVGAPGETIVPPTSVQRLVFGERRRRLPRRHDTDRPVLLGARQPSSVLAQGQAAAAVFFDAEAGPCLDRTQAALAQHTGRWQGTVSSHRTAGAKILLLVQGAAIETAELAADWLRREHRCPVGVLGLRCLRPFPGAQLVRFLENNVQVCVLERLATPLAGEPPLLRELRAAIDRAMEQGRFGGRESAGLPVLDENHRPRLLSVVYGLGGLPLRAADLVALCRTPDLGRRRQLYLGLHFAPPPSRYPKRQVLLDRLRRAYPEIATLGLVATEAESGGVDVRPAGTFTLALHRVPGGPGEGLAAEAAAQLRELVDGGVRARLGWPIATWGEPGVDLVHLGPEGLKDPGDQPPLDLILVASEHSLPPRGLTHGLSRTGALLLHSALSPEELWNRLDAETRAAVKEQGVRLYRITPGEVPDPDSEALLGALCAVLCQIDRLEASPRRLLAAREARLGEAIGSAARLECFRAALEAVAPIDPDGLAARTAHAAAADDQAPALVRRLGRSHDSYDNLPRFWDQVGVLFRHGETAELAPDPYAALGAIPPLSACFRDLSAQRERLPVLNPAVCTGCGACWSGCPEGALAAALLTPARLLEAGLAATGAEALRPIAAKLAAAMAKEAGAAPAGTGSAGDRLAAAYAGLRDRLPFPDERKAAITAAVAEVEAVLGPLPLAATEAFFHAPQAAEGQGELLAIALDPGVCKGCGLCVQVCAEEAWQWQPQDPSTLDHARQVRRAFERLPEAAEGARRLADLDALAAALLPPRATFSFSGGDGDEPGSGTRLALRLALGVTEARGRAARLEYAEQVRSTSEAIVALLRAQLAEGLPADDLEVLARALETDGTGLNRLLAAVEEQTSRLDTPRLRRLVEIARRLQDLSWRLAEGPQGLGQATQGLVLGDGEAVFPDNPFALPVILDPSGEGGQLAAGILEGQLRQATADLALLRQARLELTHPEEAARLGDQSASLSWRQLSAEEWDLCPTLWLVGQAGTLGRRGLAQIQARLGSDLPLKILLLGELDLGLAAPLGDPAQPDTDIDLALLALSRREAFIAQSALACHEHLYASLDQALRHPGPALVHVHAPSPARHGFAPSLTLERSRLAVEARVLPLFRYDPRRPGVFGHRLDLEGNPSPSQPWAEAGEAGAWTLVHWALGEARFAACFKPSEAPASAQVPIAEFLALSPTDRKGKIPVVEPPGGDPEAPRLRVDARLVQAAEARQQAWRLLQELAGVVTPFTARVRHEAEAEVAAAHQAALAVQEATYEARLQALRAEFDEETRQALRARLLQLAGYA